MFYVVIVAIGMCLASFVNVVAYRWPKNEDFIFGRSYCPNCHHELSFLDMIPIISYICLKGKCHYCHSTIGIRDTFIEILGGIVALLCYKVFGQSMMFFIALILAFIFITISLIDFDTMIIDDRFLYILLILAILSSFFNEISFIDRLIGCIGLMFPFYILNLWIECIGGADLKLMAIMGWMLGFYEALMGLLIGVIAASLYSLIMLIQKKVTIKTFIPFMPFLCAGFFISLLFHTELLQFYFYWL